MSSLKNIFTFVFLILTSEQTYGSSHSFSKFAGTYECLLYDEAYSVSAAVPGALRDISKSPDGIVVRGKLVVTVTSTGAFTAAVDYIESRAPEVIPNSVLTEVGTIQIPKTQHCTAGVKKLRDLSSKKLNFTGILTLTPAGTAVLDSTRKVKVTGGSYNLDPSFTLESVESPLTSAASIQPRLSASLTDIECVRDLQSFPYVSKGSGFVLVSKFSPQANPSGRYITTFPVVDDLEFPKDLSVGSTNLLKFDISASGVMTYSAGLPDATGSVLFKLTSGGLAVDGRFVFHLFLKGKAPGSSLLNPRKKAEYVWAVSSASTARLVKHAQRKFELLLGPDSFTEFSFLLKAGAKNVMSDETNLEWRVEHRVGSLEDVSNGQVVTKSAVQTDQAEGENGYDFGENIKAIMLKHHRLSSSGGRYSLIIGNPGEPLTKYEVTLSAKGKLLDAVFISQKSWSVQSIKSKALKLSFDATSGQLTGSLPVRGSFYKNELQIEDEDAFPSEMNKTITLFGGIYDEPASLFNPSLKGRVVAIGNARPYSVWYTEYGPAWILVDETQ